MTTITKNAGRAPSPRTSSLRTAHPCHHFPPAELRNQLRTWHLRAQTLSRCGILASSSAFKLSIHKNTLRSIPAESDSSSLSTEETRKGNSTRWHPNNAPPAPQPPHPQPNPKHTHTRSPRPKTPMPRKSHNQYGTNTLLRRRSGRSFWTASWGF